MPNTNQNRGNSNRRRNHNPRNKSFVHVVQLNNYVKPKVQEKMGTDWVLNDPKNGFFDYVMECYDGSPTNSAIIDGYVRLILGHGLTVTEGDTTILSLFKAKEIKNIVLDYKRFGSAAFEVIYSKGTGALRNVTGIYHIPRKTIAPNKRNEDGEIEFYWYCYDWGKQHQYKPEPIPVFGTSKEDREIYVLESDTSDSVYFSKPDYFPALQYAKIEEDVSNTFHSAIANNFSAGMVINFNNGVPEKEVRDKIIKQVKDNWTGSSNTNTPIISFNNSAENKTTIDLVPLNQDVHKQWEYLIDVAQKQLFKAHRVTSPMLFGIKEDVGLGNNAEELETASKLLYATVITPYQNDILGAFQEILKVNGKPAKLEFEPLIDYAKEDGTATDAGENVELSKKKDDITPIADFLIERGEDEATLEGYEVIDERKVDFSDFDGPIDNEMNLASAVTSTPQSRSEQDNPLFKVRYIYAPQTISQNSREFCRKMVSAGKVYRKEDIIEAGNQAVNAGLGPNGADTYSIWKYKGGKHCKHYWQRRVYLKTNNSIITVNEARRIINTLEPEQRNAVRLPQNETEVAQTASSSNNYWALN